MISLRKIKNVIIKIPILFAVISFFLKVKTTGTLFVQILPSSKKLQVLSEYAEKFKCKTFVETGTYKGDTVSGLSNLFEELHSIELSHELYEECKKRFVDVPKIHIWEGDSGLILPQIIHDMTEPIFFWLDAHYSGGETARGEQDSPIVKELQFILKHVKEFCILIDDARCFNGKNSYPTIHFLKKIVREYNEQQTEYPLQITVKHDIIRIFPSLT